MHKLAFLLALLIPVVADAQPKPAPAIAQLQANPSGGRAALGLVASATTDTTNAANITVGTLPAGRLPVPSASTLGGVQSAAGASHQWISGISTSGVPVLSQPAWGDLSGLPTSLAGYGITNAMPLAGGTFTGAVAHGSNAVSGSNFAISGGSVSGASVAATVANVTGSAGYQLAGTTFINIQNGGPALQYNISTDPSQLSTFNRQNIIQTTLTNSINNSNIWESFSSFLTLNGPGQNLAEINNFHGFINVAAGAYFSSGENYEASDYNNGNTPSLTQFYGLYHNFSTGTAGSASIQGFSTALINDNTTAGSVGVYQAFTVNAPSGAGTLPTFDFAFRNYDTHGVIATAGKVEIGSVTTMPTAWLQYNGPDTVVGTLAMSLLNSAGTTLLQVADNGAVTFGAITGLTQCLQVSSAGLLSGTGSACGGAGAVSSVSNSDGTLTITPTTGAAVASLALSHANTWTGAQTISVASGTGLTITGSDTSAGTFPFKVVNSANTNLFYVADDGEVTVNSQINVGQSGGTGAATGQIIFNGSVSGGVHLAPAGAAVGNVAITLPGATTTLAGLAVAQTFSAAQTFSSTAIFALQSGTAATFACFTAGGLLISSATACP